MSSYANKITDFWNKTKNELIAYSLMHIPVMSSWRIKWMDNGIEARVEQIMGEKNGVEEFVLNNDQKR